MTSLLRMGMLDRMHRPYSISGERGWFGSAQIRMQRHAEDSNNGLRKTALTPPKQAPPGPVYCTALRVLLLHTVPPSCRLPAAVHALL